MIISEVDFLQNVIINRLTGTHQVTSTRSNLTCLATWLTGVNCGVFNDILILYYWYHLL